MQLNWVSLFRPQSSCRQELFENARSGRQSASKLIHVDIGRSLYLATWVLHRAATMISLHAIQTSPHDVTIAFYNLISEKTSPHWYHILFFRGGLLHPIYLQKQGITPGGVNHYGPSQSLLTSHIYICVKLLLVLLYITKYF